MKLPSVLGLLLKIAVIGFLLAMAVGCAAGEETEEAPTSSKPRKTEKSRSGKDSTGVRAGQEDGSKDELGGGQEDEDEKPADEQTDQPPQPVARQRVTFPGSRGDTVPGYLWLPKNGGEKAPAILLMYGISGDKNSGTVSEAAKLLTDNGFAAMTIDWPGAGERGDISNGQRVTDVSLMEWTVGDYAAAYNFMSKHEAIDGNRLGYVGASMGAMTGINFAVADQRVKAIVAIVPIPNPLWGASDPSSRIAQLAGRPNLCIHSADNSDFSGMVCANAPGEKKAVSGGHELNGSRGIVVEEAMRFFKAHL